MNPLEDDEDPWPDEPDEFDPDSLGPETPDVEPDRSFEAAADVDEDLFRAFWGAVVFLNVAVAALSVGAMLVVFRGDWSTGGPALVIGAIAAAFVGRFYLASLSARGGDAEDGNRPSADGGKAADDERRPESVDGDGGGAGTDR